MSSSDSDSEISWEQQLAEFNEYSSSNTESDNETTDQCNDTIQRATKNTLLINLLWFLFLWQSVYHISEAAVKSILCFLRYFVKTLAWHIRTQHL